MSEPDTERLPDFVGIGGRRKSGDWDNYECPDCGAGICSFCECYECGWYDEEAWNEAVRRAASEHDDVYTGSLEVTDGAA